MKSVVVAPGVPAPDRLPPKLSHIRAAPVSHPLRFRRRLKRTARTLCPYAAGKASLSLPH